MIYSTGTQYLFIKCLTEQPWSRFHASLAFMLGFTERRIAHSDLGGQHFSTLVSSGVTWDHHYHRNVVLS